MSARPTLIDHMAEAARMEYALHDANAKITEALRDRTLPDPAQRYTRAYDIAVGALDRQIQALRVLIAHMRESAPVASIAPEPAPDVSVLDPAPAEDAAISPDDLYTVRPTPKGFGVIYRPDGTLIAEFDSEDGAKGLMDELNRAAERGGEEGS